MCHHLVERSLQGQIQVMFEYILLSLGVLLLVWCMLVYFSLIILLNELALNLFSKPTSAQQ